MTKKTKAIRTIAAVTAAALLGGGIYLLVKNDVAQKINWQDILIYAPTPIARETLDEAVNNSSDKPSADEMTAVRKEEETKEMGKIIGICISEKRGTAKHEVETAKLVEDWGIEGDAHAGHWHRQVSLLSYEKIEAFRAKGADIPLGAFGENLIVEGYDFRNLPVGTRFSCGDALLEMTQIGKECHSHCEIFKRMGECIMPREGVFAVVLRGGTIQKGDTIELVTEK